MTAQPTSPRPTDAELLDQVVEQVLARRRRDLTLDELDALGRALRVPCPPPRNPDRRDIAKGCGAQAGHECRSLADGLPLGRLLFHHARGKAAGVRWTPTTPDELAGRDELAAKSRDVQAREHYEATGEDLDGYFEGRPWSPDGSHHDRGGARW